jgi:hypothetical protein
MSLTKATYSMINVAPAINVKDFGAVGDGSTDDAAAIVAADTAAAALRYPVFFPPGSYRIKSTITRVSQSAWFGPSQQSNANINNEVQIFGTVGDIGDGNPMIRCAATGVTTSVSSLSFENLEFVSDKSVDFANLSATTSNGITLVDVSNVKNGLEFTGCSFKNAAFGIRQSDGDPYLDKVTLDRCHFTLLYKAIQCNPTAGLSLANCFVYDCFDWVYTKGITGTRANGAEVFLNACSFNNSSFAAEYTSITASAIVATSCWFEGGNHWLHATKYAKAEGCYFSEAYSANSNTKFSMAPNDPDVNSCMFVSAGNRIGTNTRLIDLSDVTDASSITVVCTGNYNGTNFSDTADIQTKIRAGLNYQGFGNVNTFTWNVPQGTARNSQNADYTLTIFDAGKLISHSSSVPHSWTVPSNSSAPFPLGTEITLSNEGSGAVTVAITSDTLRWQSSTGSRTLAQNGLAKIIKLSDTVWRITGEGIS